MRYKVKALQAGLLQELDLEAANEAELKQRLSSQGLELVSAHAQHRVSFRKSEFALSLFTQELIALLEAGLTLVEAVETLKEKAAADGNRVVLSRLIDGLYQGLPLSRVLGRCPSIFRRCISPPWARPKRPATWPMRSSVTTITNRGWLRLKKRRLFRRWFTRP